MKALMILLFGAVLIALTLWFIHGGRINPDCMAQPERMVRTAQGDATCVKAFP